METRDDMLITLQTLIKMYHHENDKVLPNRIYLMSLKHVIEKLRTMEWGSL